MKTVIYVFVTCLILSFGSVLSSPAAVNDDGLILYFGFEKKIMKWLPMKLVAAMTEYFLMEQHYQPKNKH